MMNQSIVELTAAKVPEAVILGQIRASKNKFDLSNAGIIELSRAGVSAAVIEAMRHPENVPIPAPPAAAAPPTPAPVASVPAAASHLVTVTGGTPFEVVLMEDIPLEPAPGTALHFQAAKDVTVNGSVVIAKGAAVSGHVVEGNKKNLLIVKRGGKPAFALAEVVAVDGANLRVKASPGRGGDKNEHNIEPPGHKGKDSLAPAGSAYLAYFDADQTVAVKK